MTPNAATTRSGALAPAATIAALALLLLLGLAACSRPEEGGGNGAEVAAITEREGARIRQASQAWARAAKAGDADRLASLYTDDAVLMPPGSPAVHGRRAIREYLAAMPAFDRVVLTQEDVEGRGDLAYVYGTFSLTVLAVPGDTASAVTEEGKFLEIHERQSDGSWPMVVDIWNSSSAPTGAGG